MAKGMNQRLKLLYLLKIFEEKTDERHPLTLAEIGAELEGYGVKAERKSLYSDMEALRLYGADIIKEQKGKQTFYYLGNRQFELAELKLLVDAVQSSRFITEKKSHELIGKLESLVSDRDAVLLQRQVFVADRVKTMNESIYYNVDHIHAAINGNEQIDFQYFQWNADKKMELKRSGEVYRVSPWALLWADENYYLIAYEKRDEKIKHFRVDKMLNIEQNGKKREGKEYFEAFDLAAYQRKMFGMFGGEEKKVKLRFKNELAGVVLDRFGKNTTFYPEDEEHFHILVDVAISRQFLAWVLGLGSEAEILAPGEVVELMREELEKQLAHYEGRT